MSLIRRKTKPETITTREIAERWNKSPERVRQLLKAAGAGKAQAVKMPNAAFEWSLRDVLEVEKKIYGEIR